MNSEKIQVLTQYMSEALPWMTEREIKDHIHILRTTSSTFDMYGPTQIRLAFEALYMSKINGLDHNQPLLAYHQEERRRAFAMGFLLLLDYQFTTQYALPGTTLVNDCIQTVVTNPLFTPAAAVDLLYAFSHHLYALQTIQVHYLSYDERHKLCSGAIANSAEASVARIFAKYAVELLYCANYLFLPYSKEYIIHDDVVTFLSMLLNGSYIPRLLIAAKSFSDAVHEMFSNYPVGLPHQWKNVLTAWQREFEVRVSAMEQLDPLRTKSYAITYGTSWFRDLTNIPSCVEPIQQFDACMCYGICNLVMEIIRTNCNEQSLLPAVVPIFTPIFLDEIALQLRLRPDYEDAKSKSEMGLQNVLDSSAYALFSSKALFKYNIHLPVQLNMMRDAIHQYYASMDPEIAAQQPEFQEFLQKFAPSGVARVQYTNSIQPVATQTALMELHRARLSMFDTEGTQTGLNVWRLTEALQILLTARNDVISVSRPDFSPASGGVSDSGSGSSES